MLSCLARQEGFPAGGGLTFRSGPHLV